MNFGPGGFRGSEAGHCFILRALLFTQFGDTKEAGVLKNISDRYDMDHDDDVLYCYEIQNEKKMQRKGLGG